MTAPTVPAPGSRVSFRLADSELAGPHNTDRHDEIIEGVVLVPHGASVLVTAPGWMWPHTVRADRTTVLQLAGAA